MVLTSLIHVLLSEQTPALPDLAVLRIARYFSWATVLASLVMLAGQRWPRWLQRAGAMVVLVWTLIPGPVSPAFWLGLAFQMPSLTSAAIAAVVLVHLWLNKATELAALSRKTAFLWAGWVGVVVGGLLLLDTFARLPLSLYSAGFSPWVLGVVVLLVVLPWIFLDVTAGARQLSLLLLLVLVVHVLLRLPTGNVWDALLDPWLWLLLLLSSTVRGIRAIRTNWRASRATRV